MRTVMPATDPTLSTPTPTPISSEPLVLAQQPLSGPWPGIDPFIFAAYHLDAYPRSNGRYGPDAALLAGRDIGMDFSGRDGWSMYHGDAVPGFPVHPHRGFETVTIVRRGLVDHADSLGATARYGQGDVQWLTAGAGIQHAEMFPLLQADADNPLELFQLWLNLPAQDKMAPPAFRMFWADDMARHVEHDAAGHRSEVVVVAGRYQPWNAGAGSGAGAATEVQPPAPPPHSWARRDDADVAIWTLRLEPGATLTLPPARAGSRRALYFFQGSTLQVGERQLGVRTVVEVQAQQPAPLHNTGTDVAEVLLLQGRPIGEPVAARGPFVMNTQAELQQAMRDYGRTQFGGWHWPDGAPTHGQAGRFARHPDGREERPGGEG